MQALQSVYCLQVELDLDLIVRVGSNHEVHVVPVRQQQLLHGVHDVFQAGFRYDMDGLLRSRRLKLTKQHLSFFNPLCSQALVLGCFVRIVLAKEAIHKLLVTMILKRIFKL